MVMYADEVSVYSRRREEKRRGLRCGYIRYGGDLG